MAALPVQTNTPDQLLLRPDKDALLAAFRGKGLDALRTPAAVIDRAVFARNCVKMLQSAAEWGASFRAHVKTHKVCVHPQSSRCVHYLILAWQTAEGTRLQLSNAGGKTHAMVVSTLMEAHEVFNAGLVADGTVNDVCLPAA